MFSTLIAVFFGAAAELSILSVPVVGLAEGAFGLAGEGFGLAVEAFGLAVEEFEIADAWPGLDGWPAFDAVVLNRSLTASRPAELLEPFRLFAPLMPSLLLISSHSFMVALLFGSSLSTLSKFRNASS